MVPYITIKKKNNGQVFLPSDLAGYTYTIACRVKRELESTVGRALYYRAGGRGFVSVVSQGRTNTL